MIEWAKHIVTIASALMVLGATLLKDLARAVAPPWSYVVATAVFLFYAGMILSVIFALKLVRLCANTAITTQPQIASGDELHKLKVQLGRTQCAFVIGLGFFSIVALSILVSWARSDGSVPTDLAQIGRAHV